MLSPRNKYITLLKSKKDTNATKTRQAYITKYTTNLPNKNKVHAYINYNIDADQNRKNKQQQQQFISGNDGNKWKKDLEVSEVDVAVYERLSNSKSKSKCRYKYNNCNGKRYMLNSQRLGHYGHGSSQANYNALISNSNNNNNNNSSTNLKNNIKNKSSNNNIYIYHNLNTNPYYKDSKENRDNRDSKDNKQNPNNNSNINNNNKKIRNSDNKNSCRKSMNSNGNNKSDQNYQHNYGNNGNGANGEQKQQQNKKFKQNFYTRLLDLDLQKAGHKNGSQAGNCYDNKANENQKRNKNRNILYSYDCVESLKNTNNTNSINSNSNSQSNVNLTSQQYYEEQARKNKQGQNCRIVLKITNPANSSTKSLTSTQNQKDFFLKLSKISQVRKHLFQHCPLAQNFITIPRQISLEYLLMQQDISGEFLNGQSLYFRAEFGDNLAGVGYGNLYEGYEDGQIQENCQVTLQHFQIIKQIGSGGFSKVFLCRSKIDNNFYAMKLIQKEMVIKNQKKGIIMNERNIMVQAKHPFIIDLKYAFESDKYIVFILQYCPGGELFGLVKKYGRLSQDIARFYIVEVLLGLAYLHSLKVVYRDIKPQNILIGMDGHVKIADLGLAKPNMQSGRLAHSFCGSPQYMSPQMILQVGHTYPVDFYCVGALLHELLTGLPPFYSQDPNQIYEAVLEREVQFPDQIQSKISPQCKNLIKSLLCKDPKQRLGSLYGSKQVLAHPWFGKNNYKNYVEKKVKPPYTFDCLEKLNLDANMNAKSQQNYQRVLKDQKTQQKLKNQKKILKNFYYSSIPFPKSYFFNKMPNHVYSKSAITPPQYEQPQYNKSYKKSRTSTKQISNSKEKVPKLFGLRNQSTERSQCSNISQISYRRSSDKNLINSSKINQKNKENLDQNLMSNNIKNKYPRESSKNSMQKYREKDISGQDSKIIKNHRKNKTNVYINKGFGLPYECSFQNFFKK